MFSFLCSSRLFSKAKEAKQSKKQNSLVKLESDNKQIIYFNFYVLFTIYKNGILKRSHSHFYDVLNMRDYAANDGRRTLL